VTGPTWLRTGRARWWWIPSGTSTGSWRLALTLPDQAAVCPTHGFGSFCAASPAGAGRVASTIGDEKRSNPALILSCASYVIRLVASLDA
jgi:hydroxyacylglutathione hydrolase